MTTQPPAGDADVLIIGAGPTGAALAGDLGQRGISVLLLDKGDAIVRDARLHSVSIRTMELARHWGIEDDLRNCGWPLDHPQDVVWGTNLSEPELARIHWPPIGEMTPPPTSPTFAQRCPQAWFNDILLRFVRRQKSVTMLVHTNVIEVTQDQDMATVIAEDASGERVTFTARYVVACDGSRSNTRRALGIGAEKSPVWGHSAEAMIRSPQLEALPLAQTLGRFTVVEPDGMSLTMLPFDGTGRYRIMVMLGDGEITESVIREAANKIAGFDIEIEMLTPILPWSNRATVATTFRDGRIFLAGDAAHTMPTTGGLGMNTGILDSFDLAWKLDAVLSGWAGDGLLDSYDVERRAGVLHSSSLAGTIYQDWVRTRTDFRQFWERIALGGEDADRARAELGEALVSTFRREFNNIPASLDYRYEQSPICISDGTPAPELDLENYTQSARPGHRAPHVWLGPNESTLDHFGPHFTLLVIGERADTATSLVDAAEQRSLPLTVLEVTDDQVVSAMREAYERTYVLVRPDGHVAWRSDSIPQHAQQIVDVVRGASLADTVTEPANHDLVSP